MNFAEVFPALRAGKKIKLSSCQETISRERKTWLTIEELLADDWEIVPEKQKLTEKQITILKGIKAMGLNYLVSDKDGFERAFVLKPIRYASLGQWSCSAPGFAAVYNCKVSNWSDPEPLCIDELLKGAE